MSSDHSDLPSSSSDILLANDSSDPPAPAVVPHTEPPPTTPHHRHSIPLAFPSLFQANTSSASLIHSTAEGRPIPVDDSTAAGRTSAFRQLNSHFPSRHRYAKSTGAQSTTYSRPVIVRTHPGPPTVAADDDDGPTRRRRRRPPGPSSKPPNSTSSSVIHRIIPFVSSAASHGPSRRHRGMLSLTRSQRRDDARRLPPVESFTFKSIVRDSGGDITSDLDRIAEICARSRYSLSNQYEVHKAPHGSGGSFSGLTATTPPSRAPAPAPAPAPPVTKNNTGGPTLQAVSSTPSDDDDNERTDGSVAKRRRRRRSVAVGTLETIMSSSRSSDEDHSKKRSAAEIADDVRGRCAARKSGDSSPLSASTSASSSSASEEPRPKRRMSSLANVVIDGGEETGDGSAGLVGGPAPPETCTEFEIRAEGGEGEGPQKGGPARTGGLLRSLSGWIWGGPGSHAEGSLRELLRSDGKGKGVEGRLF